LPATVAATIRRKVLDVCGHADALDRRMDAVGLDRAVFLGNSYGCQIIAELAVRHSERVERAIFQGPAVDPEARGFFRQLGRWLVNAVREGPTQPTENGRQWGPAGLRVFVMTLRDMHRDRIEDKLRQVAAPAMVVRGARDAIVPQAWAEQATRLLPRGRLMVVPGRPTRWRSPGPTSSPPWCCHACSVGDMCDGRSP
jgi:2-hydroxy-6-oxonona-2,4-dienedioate hydrolase